MPYSLELRIKIVLLMAKLESPTAVRRCLQQENVSDIPTRLTIQAIYDKFIETGSVKDRERSGRPSVVTEEVAAEIDQVVQNAAVASVRSIAQEVNVSKSVVHRTMRDVLGYKPYQMHLTQELYDEDKDLRVEMAEYLIPILEDQDNNGVLFFSDEANFHVSGVVNKHNCRIWAKTNPYATIDVAMNSPKITVWCAMSSKQIIGPYFFDEETVNQHNYLDMLQNYFHPIMKNKRMIKKMFFQQDGAPAHFSKNVRAWLNNNFGDRWIGRGGPISWAPRSPDLTPLDFFLWGHVKTNVYKTQVKDLNDLMARITREIQAITTETLHNVFLEIEKRLHFCIKVNGDNFEQYL
jgi:ribosomal protein S25